MRAYWKRRRKLLGRGDVYTVEVPVFPNEEGTSNFSLAYVYSGGDEGSPTLVILPGGPGLASIVPYEGVRKKARAAGFNVIMVEHRGVGCSRESSPGKDLPTDAMRVEYAARDVLAVLDDCGVEKAWFHGTSYGGYLAQVVGTIAPERVSGMFLDTTMHSARHEEEIRDYNRRLFLSDEAPGTRELSGVVWRVLDDGLATDDDVTEVVPPVYELFGPKALYRLLGNLVAGRRAEWNFLRGQFAKELEGDVDPFYFDFDLAGAIWYRELVPPIADERPFDVSKVIADKAGKFPEFEGELYDLGEQAAYFEWPVVLFSGERDVRVPVFVVQEIDALLPHSLHISFSNTGHDVLRFRTQAVLAIEAACVQGGLEEAERTATRVVSARRRHPQTLVSDLLAAYLAAVGRLSSSLRRTKRGRATQT